MEKQEERHNLATSLKTRHIVMLSLGGAIGSGLFVGAGSVIQEAGPAALLSYIIAGLALYVVMYGVGRMVIHGEDNSHEVGMSGIIRPYVGARWAHFTDWVYWSTWMAVLIAEQAGVSTVLEQLFPGVPQWVYALIVTVLATAINLYSVRAFAETEYWLAFVKIAVIVILIVVGICLLLVNSPQLGFQPSHESLEAAKSVAPSFAPGGFKGILASLLVVIFSFGGSELAAVTVAETENPKVAIPKAIRGVLLRIISFYVVPIFLFIQLLPWKTVTADAESPFALIFNRVGIPHADKIILVVIIIAIFSAVNSAIYATSRSLYSRVQHSESGLGKSLSQLSNNQVPIRAILVSSSVLVLGVILTAIFKDQFWQFVAGSISYTITIVWVLLLLAAVIMYFKRRETGNWFLKILTIVVLAALIYVLYTQITTNPWYLSLFALIICLLSLLSYRKAK